MKRILLFGTVIFCVFVFLGCATVQRDRDVSQQALLEPKTLIRFADVPVPAGFKLLSKDSYTFETAGVRMGMLTYVGKAMPEQVINFYREQMQMFGWNLLNVVEYGERLLNFDRDTETCIVRLVSRGSKVIVTITLGPKPQIPKKTAEPIK